MNGTLSIYNSTLAYNQTLTGSNITAPAPELTQGGAVYHLSLGQNASPAVLHLGNSILSNSLSSGSSVELVTDNQQGKTTTVLDSSGPSLVTSCNFCDSQTLVGSLQLIVKQDPMLNRLADNGGATQTLAPLPTSLVIGRGEPGLCSGTLVGGLDQRQQARPAACTLGAYEASPSGGVTASGCQVGAGRSASRGALAGLFLLALALLRSRRRQLG